MAAHVVPVELEKCSHQPGKKFIRSFSSGLSLHEIYDDIHGSHSCSIKGTEFSVYFGEFQVDRTLSVGDLIGATSSIGAKSLRFVCQENPDMSVLKQAADSATKKAIDAFQVLMSKGRDYPDKKDYSNLTKKDELYNELVADFREKELSFPKATAKSDGQYFIQYDSRLDQQCCVMLCGMLQISMTPSMKRVLEKVFLQSQSFSKNTKTIMTLKEKR